MSKAGVWESCREASPVLNVVIRKNENRKKKRFETRDIRRALPSFSRSGHQSRASCLVSSCQLHSRGYLSSRKSLFLDYQISPDALAHTTICTPFPQNFFLNIFRLCPPAHLREWITSQRLIRQTGRWT